MHSATNWTHSNIKLFRNLIDHKFLGAKRLAAKDEILNGLSFQQRNKVEKVGIQGFKRALGDCFFHLVGEFAPETWAETEFSPRRFLRCRGL